MRLFRTVVCAFIVITFAALIAAQTTTDTQPQAGKPAANAPKPRLSPPGEASCGFADGKKINVAYGRPSMRGRKIMGGLVPYGKVWRTGANEATSFETQAPLMIGTTEVPAGKYTLYTLPRENGWILIINKQTGQWGTQYDESQDLARVDMNVRVQDSEPPVEQFTISFEPTGKTSCKMSLRWEHTSASVEMEEAATTNRMK